MSKHLILRAVGAAAAAVIVGAAVVSAGSTGENTSEARARLTMIVPADPGGGWDLVARESQNAYRGGDIVANTQVVNVPGAGGTIGLAQAIRLEGRANTLMVTGTVMIGGIVVNQSSHTLNDVTPIARLADDYEVVVVPADSPYEDMSDLAAALREDPGSVAIGGGSLGGTDHLLAAMIGRDVGTDPQEINYIPFAGGSQALTSLLSHSIDVGISGYNEFSDQVSAGNVRILGVSANERVEGIDAPTLAEQDIDAVLPNWRGVMAPPGITDEERAELTAIVTEMRATPEWQDTLERNRWDDTFQTGPEFEEFLGSEIDRITTVTEELGLA
ncbi:Bug family tripartite tricarboxylate transporter substrate binding protein [Marinitenerispora sediminis]|uniref:Tricarboxylic transporter n=1 Tax=Marinitenerispora sediminis TaxID=1931232 RepID=A0A368T0K0_9ACTN|nr:tripartite tricarboxylate transporter substrate-binding protein [Marinitenerispora sediminis]RCV48859.1 tricarboxylic transporter [Marinitenerispora sediminis]RCV51277.1 tricarboxylic transporter [Marinitenerispora sediminis]RCV52924.1 tricarboxylic transporter [Marinitenerispora sediminis]